MRRLLKALTLCGLLLGLGCQNTPPTTTESEKLEAAQKSENQPTPTAVAGTSPVRKQRSMARSTGTTVAAERKEFRPLSPVSTKYTLPAQSEVSVRLIDAIKIGRASCRERVYVLV